MTARRRTIRLIREIEKLPADERVWVLVRLIGGCLPPAADEAKFDRNQLLRRYRARWHAEASFDGAASSIAREMANYRATSWRFDQLRIRPHSKDEKRHDQFEIMKADPTSVGFEGLRKILKLGIL